MLTINQLAILLLVVSFTFVVHVIANLWLHVKLDARVKKLRSPRRRGSLMNPCCPWRTCA
ncbi:MAG: hypothetical protein ACLSVD_19115 [Eggerthellaceae bacterium]